MMEIGKHEEESAAGGGSSKPVYRVHVFCCTHERPATHRRGSCGGKGGRALCDYMCRRAITVGLRDIRINHAGCMSVCEYGPILVIYPDGVWYRYESESDIDEILRSHVVRGIPVERLLLRIESAKLHG